VAPDQSARLAAATERLRAETSVPGLLGTTARTFVEVLDAEACTISRAIGDLLVDLIQHRKTGTADRLGHGYLISDYPLTREVIEQREPRTVSLHDPDADPAEAKLLRELGFDSLLMITLEAGDDAWGLIEVYGEKGRRFTDEDVLLVRDLTAEVGGLLDGLGRPAV
jgi:GAF domain-containing protein